MYNVMDVYFTLPEEQHNSVLLIGVNLSYLPSLASLIFFFFLDDISIDLSADSNCE